MRISDKGVAIIKQFEGCRLEPYLDTGGVPTIGYGCTRYENGAVVQLSDLPINQLRANELLAHRLVEFESGVSGSLKVSVSQNQFDALVSFAFNVGVGNLKSSTLLQKLNACDDVGAAAEFSRWYFDNKKPLKGLLRRRVAEMQLFLKD